MLFLIHYKTLHYIFILTIYENFKSVFFHIFAIMFVIISEFLIVEETFDLPQVKRSVIISNKLVYTSSLTCWQTT